MTQGSSGSSRRTRAKTQLLRLLDEETLSVNDVRAICGDREASPKDAQRVDRIRERRKDAFYSDLLFALCHQYIPAGKAHRLWDEILLHKKAMTEALGRKVGIGVAALDYLTTVHPIIVNPVIVSEPNMNTVAEVATKDGLTRLYDHSTFFSKLRDELKRQRRYEGPTSVILFDIDHFKQVNDTHGHLEGDRILQDLAALVTKTLRHVDVASRYGGEEFALLLPATHLDEASKFAERLRSRVEHQIRPDLPLTISLGVATAPKDGNHPEAIVQSADLALYHAKNNGRNQTASFRHLPKQEE